MIPGRLPKRGFRFKIHAQYINIARRLGTRCAAKSKHAFLSLWDRQRCFRTRGRRWIRVQSQPTKPCHTGFCTGICRGVGCFHHVWQHKHSEVGPCLDGKPTRDIRKRTRERVDDKGSGLSLCGKRRVLYPGHASRDVPHHHGTNGTEGDGIREDTEQSHGKDVQNKYYSDPESDSESVSEGIE